MRKSFKPIVIVLIYLSGKTILAYRKLHFLLLLRTNEKTLNLVNDHLKFISQSIGKTPKTKLFVLRLKTEIQRKNVPGLNALCDEFARKTKRCRSGPILDQLIRKITEIPLLMETIKNNQLKMYQIARLGNLKIVKLTRRLEKM